MRALRTASPPLYDADFTLGKLAWAVSIVMSRSWPGPYGQGATPVEAAALGLGFSPRGEARAPDGSANDSVSLNPKPDGFAASGGAMTWDSSLWVHTLVPGLGFRV